MPLVESKEAAHYTPYHGRSTEWCAICQFWTVGPTSTSMGLCHVVSGPINPDGWCRHFRHVTEAA